MAQKDEASGNQAREEVASDTDAEREQWRQVAELLNDALDLKDHERQRFLEQLEDSTRLRVEALLELEAQSVEEDFLAAPIFTLKQHVEEERVGQRVGVYSLTRELGSGGMGTVYLAERVDGEFEQQVAIKILKRGMDTNEIVRRFQAERQILAGLEHPNIAKLYDGGTTDDGLPYLVMEYIDGLPIDVFCDRSRLTVKQRLELFRQVCEAVRLAHQNLIVHRDLKPANILVTPQGVPKLLDFGIAKLLSPDEHQAMTVTAEIAPLTPHYASPEQIRGETITTAVDVYALGVLLYELLSGHRPYRVDTLTPQKLEQAICIQEPSRPSTAFARAYERADREDATITVSAEEIAQARAVEPFRLKRLLSGDLDTIVLRALRKEPERRFASVDQLSEDVRRYLVGLPITSRPDTWGYRTQKFVRRNPWGVAAGLTIFLLVTGATISTSMQLEKIKEQNQSIRDKNREISQEVARQEQVTQFLIQLVRTPEPNRSRGETLTVQDALLSAEQGLAEGLPEDRDLRSMIHNAVGQVYMHLGLLEEAGPHLEKALGIRQNLAHEDPRQLIASLLNLAHLKGLEGQMKDAEELTKRAIEYLRVESPEGSQLLAEALNNLAGFLRKQERYEEAEPIAREGLAMKMTLGGDEIELAFSYNTLATIRYSRGDPDEAVELYRKALEIRQRLEPNTTHLANTLNSLGTTLFDQQNLPGEALPYLQEGYEIRIKIYDQPHPQHITSYHNLAMVHLMLGNTTEAASNLEKGFDVLMKLQKPQPVLLSLLQKDRAMLFEAEGLWAQCERDARAALTLYAGGRGAEARRAEVESVLGGCLAGQGNLDEARDLLIGSHRSLVDAIGEGRRATRQALARKVNHLGDESVERTALSL